VVPRALRLLTVTCIVLICHAAPAHADWQLAPFFGYAFKGSTTLLNLEDGAAKVHWNFGGTATFIGAGPVGVEGVFIFIPHFFEAGNIGAIATSRTYALMGNVVVAAPKGWNEYGLRPFVSGGLGLMRATQQTTVNVLPLNESMLGYNVGGGAVGFITDHTGLRFDLRYYSSLSRNEDSPAIGPAQLRYWTGTVGVVFKY
jgi:hypothetical protein